MIDRTHAVIQSSGNARLLGVARSTAYYQPMPVSGAVLEPDAPD
jgi:hypothetical protein